MGFMSLMVIVLNNKLSLLTKNINIEIISSIKLIAIDIGLQNDEL